MPKNLIKVPKNPLASNRKFECATEGKLKLYPRYIRRRGNSNFYFDPDSIAAQQVDELFEITIRDHIRDLQEDYWDRSW